jgi:hypothetical protein
VLKEISKHRQIVMLFLFLHVLLPSNAIGADLILPPRNYAFALSPFRFRPGRLRVWRGAGALIPFNKD